LWPSCTTLLAGFAVPAQRTLYMVCVVAAALWCGKATSASVVLAAALVIVLLLDPWAVTSAGFWLSFGAVAAILFVVVNRVAQGGWFEGWLRTQWAVTIALLPLLLALFQQVSLISPVANAFAIPVVSFVVAPLALVGMLLPVRCRARARAFRDGLLHVRPGSAERGARCRLGTARTAGLDDSSGGGGHVVDDAAARGSPRAGSVRSHASRSTSWFRRRRVPAS
jgi:ComEC/Rec2-related protein